jgi:RNA-directed DNA polymerase
MRKTAKASSALTDIASIAALQNALNAVARNKLGRPTAARRGHDGVYLVDFAHHQDASINELAQKLRGKTYAFSPLDPVLIPKGENKHRVICIPTVNDRVVQRAILNHIGPKQEWMKNPISFGFVSHGGVQKAVERAIKLRNRLPWVFKTDITKFFDNIDRELLKNQIARKIQQRSIRALLFDAVDCEIRYQTKADEARYAKYGLKKGQGVRQGMPLSPFFANLFLADFDKKCHEMGIAAIRYADDLVFFSSSEQGAQAIKKLCLEELEKISLSIPDVAEGSKSQIYAPDQTAEFLGIELTPLGTGKYIIKIGHGTRRNIRAGMFSLGNLSELKSRKIDIHKFGNTISSTVAAYRAAYSFCSNHGEFSVQLDEWSATVRRRITKQLGIDLSKLSSDGKWFLGLD